MSNIILCGTHCTGKTTLLENLSLHNFPELKFIQSSTREVKDLGLPINNEADNYDLTQVICAGRDFEKIICNSNTIFDRCIIDTYVYTLYFFRNGKVSDRVLDIVSGLMLQALANEKIGKIFLLKPDFKLVGDGVRSEDEEFRQDIHIIFQNLLHNLSVEFEILEGSQEEKNKRVEEYLKEIKLI